MNLDQAPGVAAAIADLDTTLLPGAVGALILLQFVQIPIAVLLARRVRGHRAERVTLLERALSASDGERRRIAADLHDGVLPDLAAVALAADALAEVVPDAQRPMVEHLGRAIRTTISGLRRLAFHVNPPNLTGAGLPGAMEELAEPLRAAGTRVCVEVGSMPPLDRDVANAVFRVAREGLANVARHARAGSVMVSLGPAGPDRIVLRMHDDGVGLGPRAGRIGRIVTGPAAAARAGRGPGRTDVGRARGRGRHHPHRVPAAADALTGRP